MSVITAAGQRIEVLPKKLTWLEALHLNNIAGRVMFPNSAFNGIFLGKDKSGNFKPIPEEIRIAEPFYTGTIGVIGAKGKPLGNRVETECDYEGQRKTTVFEADGTLASLVDGAIFCDHSFTSFGLPLIPLYDERTNKLIRTHEEMLKANVVIIQFNGNAYHAHLIQNRNGGIFEKVGCEYAYCCDEYTYCCFSDSAALGLVARGSNIFSDCIHRVVELGNAPSDAYGVAVIERQPRIRFEEHNGPSPYRDAPRAVEVNPEPRTQDQEQEIPEKPGVLKRFAAAIGFG